MKNFDISYRNRFASRRIENTLRLAENYRNDPERVERLKLQECIVCYYNVRITGQAFTQWHCVLCNKEGMHHNTGIPTLCKDCAEKEGLCKQCGATLHIKPIDKI